jgi:diguanylate cyclase (GGDEF)-like protein/PAS domain S-box-containing protein
VPRRKEGQQAEADRELRFLIMEDAVADAKLCERELRRAGLRFEMRRVETLAEFEAELDRFVPDLIFSDFTFPGGFDGLAALEIARRKLPKVPFIFVSGTIGEERAVEAIKRGAADYVLKDRMARLVPAVIQVLERAQLLKEKEQAEAALRTSDFLYHSIFDNIAEGILLCTLDGGLLAANPAAARMLGYGSPEDLVSSVTNPNLRLYAESSDWRDLIRRAQQDGEVRGFETRAIRKDGEKLWASLSARLVRDESDGIPRLLTVIADISERKLQQQKIERLSRIRSLSSGINAAIVRAGSRQDLLDEACRIAVERGGFGIAWIGKYDPVTLEVNPIAWAGVSPEHFTRKTTVHPDMSEGQGAVGHAIRERKPVFVNDMTVNPAIGGQRREEAIRRGYRSLIALPLFAGGDVFGNLSLFTKELNFFDDEEVALLAELAGNVSFALESIERKQKIERLSRVRAVTSEINAVILRSRNKQTLLYDACLTAIEHGGFGIAWIGDFDPERMEIQPVASAGLDDGSSLMHSVLSARADGPHAGGVLPQVVRERRPVFNNDITKNAEIGGERRREAIRRGYRSVIGLPLIVEGAVTGTFSLFVKDVDFFDDEEVKLLNELAGNISFALEHMARQARLDKLSRIRAISSGINATIARVRERDALLREICRVSSEQGGFDITWIGTVSTTKQEIRAISWTGFSDAIAQRVSWKTSMAAQGTLSEAIRTRQPSVRNDIERELAAGGMRTEALQHGCGSTVCLPLVVNDEVVALISLFATGRGFFDQDEMAILNEIAPNISFALESIERQEKFERLSRIRLVLGEINSAIVRIHDRQALFDEACRIAVGAGGLTFAWIGLVERDPMQIRPEAWAGVEDPVLSNRQAPRPLDEREPGGPGPFAQAVLEKRATVVNDVQNDPRIRRKQDHLDRNIHSIAVLPLLVAGDAIGVLELHAREAGFFDEEEMKLLLELAGDIAFALQTIDRQERLDYLSYYDAVTGLPNRTLFVDRTGQQMRSRGGEPRMVALILLNIERFRYINESYGRHGGDELLKLVAQRLEAAFGGKDYLARTGADGFGVVIRGIRDAAAAAHAAENLALGCFRDPYRLAGQELRVTAKAGIAMFPADGGDADALYRNAEAALKKARDSGERYLFYAADMNARAAHALSLENRLRKAVETQQFVLHYQPKIELSNDRICGLEALIRWQEPGGELVAPGAFIPLLEETGLILEVGKWAIEQALTQHREWTARGCTAPRIAVNVSAIQLQQKDFSDMAVSVVQATGGGSSALELEVTESLLMKDVEGSIRKLSFLRGLGIHIAMDDFGTGYSSLSYIARLPIDLVKIDRSFINGMASSPQDMAIVTTIIALAHSLNLRVVAEGVETESQSKLLKLLKCDEAQGFLFSKPLPAAEIEPLLRTLASA